MQLLATDCFDVLLLDNWMPKLAGSEVCRLVRSLDQKLPIFFCSGAATDADKKSALTAGTQGYLVKPFDPEDLIESLRAALNIQTT